jgi:sterol desaturase/sphingolipid hydroxylase (fatty acid hydroxylase superfamily)
MSLLDILPEISLPAVLQRLLPPNAVRHLQPMIALTTSAVTVYLLTAVALYTLLWPKVLFFHPKYLPRSRLRTVPQVYTELIDSLANIIMVAIMSYPILYAQRGHFVPTDVSVPSSTNVQLAAAVWFACDIVGYIVHRILHSNSILFEYLHKNAHQWPGK